MNERESKTDHLGYLSFIIVTERFSLTLNRSLSKS